MKTVSYSELRKTLNECLDQVCADRAPLLVTRRDGKPVVLMSLAEYRGFEETLHLLSDPANAERLRELITQAEAGQLIERDIDPCS